MGFCSEEVHKRFLRACPSIEKYVVDSGIQLIKFRLNKICTRSKKTVLNQSSESSEPGKLESCESKFYLIGCPTNIPQ